MRVIARRAALAVLACGTSLAGLAAGCSAVLGIHDIGPSQEAGGVDASDDRLVTTDGTSPDVAPDAGPGADTGADAALQDVAVCIPVDAGMPPSSGGGACAAVDDAESTCFPHDQTGWSPVWVSPVGLRTQVCTTQQITDFYDDCMGASSTVPLCNTWIASNGACHSCLVTGVGATNYGAIVSGHLTTYLNVAGCIAALEPCNVACAEAFNAYLQCSNAACDPSCSTQASGIACENEALNCATCDGFLPAAQCVFELTGPEHPAYTPCVANIGGAYAASLEGIAETLCGF
jgi:hypothetical protein